MGGKINNSVVPTPIISLQRNIIRSPAVTRDRCLALLRSSVRREMLKTNDLNAVYQALFFMFLRCMGPDHCEDVQHWRPALLLYTWIVFVPEGIAAASRPDKALASVFP